MISDLRVAREGQLLFLKLGGSLITDKTQTHTARPEVIQRLANEIARALQEKPDMRLILGHGSGSYGHAPAKKYGTRQGVHSAEAWRGFVEVWREAAQLNHLVVDALSAAGLPAVSFPPSASLLAEDGKVFSWDLAALDAALSAGLLPVVYGDVVFDRVRGGTIFSTEDLFEHLAQVFTPRRVLLAGSEPGVWADYPLCERLLHVITPQDVGAVWQNLRGSSAPDVTGGMQSKVLQSIEMVSKHRCLEVLIFSGEVEGAVFQALLGENPGTRIHSP